MKINLIKSVAYLLFFQIAIVCSSYSQTNSIYYVTKGGISFQAEIVKSFTPGDPNPQLRFRHTNLATGNMHYEDFMDYVSDAGEHWRASIHYNPDNQSILFKHCRFDELEACHYDNIINITDFSSCKQNYRFNNFSLSQFQNPSHIITLNQTFLGCHQPGTHQNPVQETRNICSSEQIPSGWVVISQFACIGCPSRAGSVCVERTIKNTNQLPVGAVERICPGSPIPMGWKVINGEPCGGSCFDRAGQACSLRVIRKG